MQWENYFVQGNRKGRAPYQAHKDMAQRDGKISLYQAEFGDKFNKMPQLPIVRAGSGRERNNPHSTHVSCYPLMNSSYI